MRSRIAHGRIVSVAAVAIHLPPLGVRSRAVLRDVDEDAVSWSDDEGLEERVHLRIDNYSGFIQLHPLDPHKLNLGEPMQ